jgi:hypothetical protein
MTNRATLTGLVASLLLAGLSAIGAPSALAEGDPLAGGSTELKLQKSLGSALRGHGVKLVAIRPAKVRRKNGNAWLPVSGGELDPTTGEGLILHKGRIGFRRGPRQVFMRSVTLDTKRRLITAEVGYKKMKIAFARKISFAREVDGRGQAFGTEITVRELSLTGPLARKLDSRLHIRLFKARRSFARSSSATEPLTVKVIPVTPGIKGGGLMYLRPLDDAVSKLAAKGVIWPEWPCDLCVATVRLESADWWGSGYLLPGFHITGGRIAFDRSIGELTTEGGMRVATNDPDSNPAVVILRDITADFTARILTADVELQPALGDIGRVTVGTIGQDDIEPGTGRDNGVRLTATTASVINHVFPGPSAADFSTGDVLFILGDSAVTR